MTLVTLSFESSNEGITHRLQGCVIGLHYTLWRVHKAGTAEVEHVDAESQAARKGVKPGWKVFKVNGLEVEHYNVQET